MSFEEFVIMVGLSTIGALIYGFCGFILWVLITIINIIKFHNKEYK